MSDDSKFSVGERKILVDLYAMNVTKERSPTITDRLLINKFKIQNIYWPRFFFNELVPYLSYEYYGD